MCLICIEYEKGKLNITEAFDNLAEMKDFLNEDHIKEVEDMLWDEMYRANGDWGFFKP